MWSTAVVLQRSPVRGPWTVTDPPTDAPSVLITEGASHPRPVEWTFTDNTLLPFPLGTFGAPSRTAVCPLTPPLRTTHVEKLVPASISITFFILPQILLLLLLRLVHCAAGGVVTCCSSNIWARQLHSLITVLLCRYFCFAWCRMWINIRTLKVLFCTLIKENPIPAGVNSQYWSLTKFFITF